MFYWETDHKKSLGLRRKKPHKGLCFLPSPSEVPSRPAVGVGNIGAAVLAVCNQPREDSVVGMTQNSVLFPLQASGHHLFPWQRLYRVAGGV